MFRPLHKIIPPTCLFFPRKVKKGVKPAEFVVFVMTSNINGEAKHDLKGHSGSALGNV